MATTIPVFFRAAPLPQNFRGTPQEFLDAIVARLGIESQEQIAFFVSGSTEPGSNVGPWLKNEQTWYVWDDNEGGYIPQIIDQVSLKYAVQNAEPDPDDFLFWIELNSNGKGVSLKTSYAGAWHDVYEDMFAEYSTTVEMDAAIDSAITTATNTYPVSVLTGDAVQVDVDGSFYKIENYTDEVFDPGNVYDTGTTRYVAPSDGYYMINAEVQVDNYNAVAADVEIGMYAGVNGGAGAGPSSGTSVAGPPGSRWYPQIAGLAQLNAGDFIEIFIAINDGSSGHVVSVSNGSMSVFKVQDA